MGVVGVNATAAILRVGLIKDWTMTVQHGQIEPSSWNHVQAELNDLLLLQCLYNGKL